MIKFDTSGNNDALEIRGNLMDLVCETLSMIKCIYRSISRDNPEMAERYQNMMEKGFEACFLSDSELKKITEKMEEDNKKAVEELDKLSKFLEFLQDRAKDIYKTAEEKDADTERLRKAFMSADFESDEQFMDWLHGKED